MTHQNQFEEPILYSASKGWKIFMTIIGAALIALGCWGIYFGVATKNDGGDALGTLLLFGGLGLGLALLGAFAAYAFYKYRIAFYADRIVYHEGFAPKEIAFDDCEGFRIISTDNGSSIKLFPKDELKPKKVKAIRIGLYMNEPQAFLEAVSAKLKNLDEEEFEEATQSILQNEDLGRSEAERADALAAAFKITKPLNHFSIGLVFWLIFYPQPYRVAIWCIVALPFLALLLVFPYRAIVKSDGNKTDPHPEIAQTLLLPPLALFLRAILDWDLLSWAKVWLPAAAIALILFGLNLAILSDSRRKWQAIAAMIFAGIYGVGAAITLNGIHDNSAPLHFTATVDEKLPSGSDDLSYSVKITDIKPLSANQPEVAEIKNLREVQISEELYNAVTAGDPIIVSAKEGAFNIPWYVASKG